MLDPEYASSGGVALVSMTAGQMQVAAPAATVSTVTGVISDTAQLGADILKGDPGAGAEFRESILPDVAGALTETGLKAIGVPGPMAQAAGISVDTAMTAAEKAGDIVGNQSEGPQKQCNRDGCN